VHADLAGLEIDRLAAAEDGAAFRSTTPLVPKERIERAVFAFSATRR
jgi:hypothetical protein